MLRSAPTAEKKINNLKYDTGIILQYKSKIHKEIIWNITNVLRSWVLAL